MRCRETDDTLGSDTAPNLSYSCWSSSILRGPTWPAFRWPAPIGLAATQLDHMSYFPPSSSIPTWVCLSFINHDQFSSLKKSPATGASCFHLLSKLRTPHRLANKVNHILTGGLSQLRFVESQASWVVLTGPQINVKATVWGICKHFYKLWRLGIRQSVRMKSGVRLHGHKAQAPFTHPLVLAFKV